MNKAVFFLGILPRGGKIEHRNFMGGGGGGGAKLLRHTMGSWGIPSQDFFGI